MLSSECSLFYRNMQSLSSHTATTSTNFKCWTGGTQTIIKFKAERLTRNSNKVSYHSILHLVFIPLEAQSRGALRFFFVFIVLFVKMSLKPISYFLRKTRKIICLVLFIYFKFHFFTSETCLNPHVLCLEQWKRTTMLYWLSS